MTTYFCKCGRPVKKSANADNTGNRDTAGCEGCPYLLPWGPMVWEEGQKAYVQDVKGQECRMSPTINYATTYRGQADDKCTLHIVSLDLDFLDQVQAWIYDNAADTLSAGFSRGSIRAVEFCDQGRYSLSISCAQNKKGMAAKAALLDRFFTASRGRRDMTPAQEKARILDAIRKGKEQAQRKDTAMKKLNDRCPLQQECERTCQVVGHERDCDYYVNNRYCTEGIPDQDELLAEEEIRQEREREERYLASLSADPAEPVTYQNEYGTLFAVREHKGAPALMCKAKGADSWALSGVLAAVRGEAYTAADLQEVLDEYARAHGWEKAVLEDLANPTIAAAGAPPCAPTVSDAQTSPSPNADAGAKTGGNGDVAACACAGCNRSDCTCAGGHDVLGRADCDGRCNCSQSGCTYAIRHPENPTAAAPASLEAKDMNVPTFDYSGLDDPTRDTLRWAEREIGDARRDYIARIAQAVSIAHDALCATVVQNLDNGKFTKSEESFQRWCESVGIKRSTAYNLLQVQALLSGSTPEEQATLEAASPSLLYAAAKPSAPAELVQAVKDGDITTHKQYQEALAEIRARDAKIKDLLEMSEAADRRAEDEARKRKDADEGYAAAMDTLRQAQEDAADADARARSAENRAAGAQKLADQRGTENAELKAKLRELEARPVEVAVAQPDENQIEAWRKEGEARILATARDLAGKARQAQQQAECHASDLEDENNRLRDALNRTGQLDQSAAMACGACSAALGAWFESTARDVPADLGPALTRMKRLRMALDIAIENGVWPDDNVLDDLGGEAL